VIRPEWEKEEKRDDLVLSPDRPPMGEDDLSEGGQGLVEVAQVVECLPSKCEALSSNLIYI
jgi:hypothetical protein